MSEALIKKINNAFDPLEPLQPGDPRYVDCSKVRGDENILRELGKTILRSDSPTCQLYTGHRGAGKSTELLRLRHDLMKQGCEVVYFAVDKEDIDAEDAQYTDLLLALTRNVLEQLSQYANPNPLLEWAKSRGQELVKLGLSVVDFSSLNLDVPLFGKVTAVLRQAPNREKRQNVRDKLENHVGSLTEILNEFIKEATQKSEKKLVAIADNLDRIAPIMRTDNRLNHDVIFLESQLGKLNCHTIYTFPISMLYSERGPRLRAEYTDIQVLPMVQIRDRQGKDVQAGIDKIVEMIEKRVASCDKNAVLVPGVFESEAVLKKLCMATGGHMREVVLLMRTTLNWTDNLPITEKAVQRAIAKARNQYRMAIEEEDWEKLAQVYLEKRLIGDDEYRNLLFNRCLMEYQDCDDNNDAVRWHSVHPVIEGIEEFQAAVAKLKEQSAQQSTPAQP